MVELRISDSGSGIRQNKGRKFSALLPTKKKARESGWRMTSGSCSCIMQIDFFSEPGKGTTFVLRFRWRVPHNELRAISILLAGYLLTPACSLHPGTTAAKAPATAPKPLLRLPARRYRVRSASLRAADAGESAEPATHPGRGPATVRPSRRPARDRQSNRPPTRTPRPEPRQQGYRPAAGRASGDSPASRPRIRPVETPAERQRLMTGIAAASGRCRIRLPRPKNRQ